MNFKKLLIFSFIFMNSPFFGHSQSSKTTISGYVKDIRNGEGLIGVSVYIKELGTGNSTNTYGFYSLTVPDGNYNLIFSYIGYNKVVKTLVANGEPIALNLEMVEEGKQLDEVVVSAKKEDENVKSLSRINKYFDGCFKSNGYE